MDRSSLLSSLVTALAGSLLVARWLVPAESAAQGETLWIVQLWLAAALLWTWQRLRKGDFRLRWDWCDAALGILVLGHVVSAVAVVLTDGHTRAAVNMLWEWVALGVSFVLLRQIVDNTAEARRLLLVMTATAATISGFGLWQHYVWYPRVAEQYTATRAELEHLQQLPPAQTPQVAARRRERIRQLRQELVSQGVPLQGRSRRLWEQRLQASSEPFGFFALANTLGGLLAAWLVVSVAVAWGAWNRQRSWIARCGILLAITVLGYCLILTKSRTAWVGLAAGLAVWALIKRRVQSREPKVESPESTVQSRESRAGGSPPSTLHSQLSALRSPLSRGPQLKSVLIGGTAAGILILLAGFSGGLDRKVLSEAPKSLIYRLQYWQGTWEVIREHPWLGTGPGNFRQAYLRHKVPASSEEIADPHNFLLDLWTSGGLLAVAGFFALAVAGSVALGKCSRRSSDRATGSVKYEISNANSQIPNPKSEIRNPLILGGGVAFLLVFLVGLLFGEGVDWRLTVLLLAWIPAVMLLAKPLATASVSSLALWAAGVTLLVHLLGAGGIEMPVVMQTLLVFLVVGAAPRTESRERKAKSREPRTASRGLSILLCLLLGLFAGCLFSATAPVLNRQALVASGDAALMQAGHASRARRLYRRAADEDPLSPRPWARLAQIAFAEWKQSPSEAEEPFRQAVRLGKQAIWCDPHNAGYYRTLGQWFLRRFERTGGQEAARSAVDYLDEAARLHPSHSGIRAELARASHLAGEEQRAAREAWRALRLDRINRRAGHRDTFLDESTLQQLQRMAAGESRRGPSRADRN